MSTVEPKASIGHQKLWQLHGLAKDSGQVALAHEIADLIAASSGGELAENAGIELPDREAIHAQVLMRPGNVRTSLENVDDVVAALSALGFFRAAPVPPSSLTVTHAQLLSWQKEALSWKTPSIGIEIMHILAQADQPSKPRISPCGVQMVDCPECGNQWDHYFSCGYEESPAAEPATDAVGGRS
ncbi:hypothetical protein [Pseudomonas sp. NPDC096950]|uniref:hypothetical protein n=1 Tax=Pseudomonas sp. NPDC096950 TaxID=3364485 RepID=UPI00383A069A